MITKVNPRKLRLILCVNFLEEAMHCRGEKNDSNSIYRNTSKQINRSFNFLTESQVKKCRKMLEQVNV